MKVEFQIGDEALLKLTGNRLAQRRLAMNLTQAQLAEQAGIGLRTVQRLEMGVAATQLSVFLRVCRVLGLIERFDAFIPQETASPITQLHLQGRSRKRATGRKTATGPAKTWTWGKSS